MRRHRPLKEIGPTRSDCGRRRWPVVCRAGFRTQPGAVRTPVCAGLEQNPLHVSLGYDLGYERALLS